MSASSTEATWKAWLSSPKSSRKAPRVGGRRRGGRRSGRARQQAGGRVGVAGIHHVQPLQAQLAGDDGGAAGLRRPGGVELEAQAVGGQAEVAAALAGRLLGPEAGEVAAELQAGLVAPPGAAQVVLHVDEDIAEEGLAGLLPEDGAVLVADADKGLGLGLALLHEGGADAEELLQEAGEQAGAGALTGDGGGLGDIGRHGRAAAASSRGALVGRRGCPAGWAVAVACVRRRAVGGAARRRRGDLSSLTVSRELVHSGRARRSSPRRGVPGSVRG